jgi:glucan 1,3-beta-glucosidase
MNNLNNLNNPLTHVTGSADFMNDLILNGGNIGLQIRNQQFTIRNIAFNNVAIAVSQLWSWGWLYQGLKINNCQRGIDISASGRTDQKVDFVVVIDSTITNTPVGIITASIQPDHQVLQEVSSLRTSFSMM